MKINKNTSLFFFFLVLFQVNCMTSKKESIDWDRVYSDQGLEKVQIDGNNIIVNLRYSSANNFIGKDVYGNLEVAYLQPEALQKLYIAEKLLTQKYPELQLLIWDAARPRRIQQVLWDTVDIPINERSQYVADPESGSIHNYGCAIDLTLADSLGNPLDMGTDYDEFSETAHITNESQLVENGTLTKSQVDNRLILREIMTQAQFSPINSEWWHFDAFSREETKIRYKIVE